MSLNACGVGATGGRSTLPPRNPLPPVPSEASSAPSATSAGSAAPSASVSASPVPLPSGVAVSAGWRLLPLARGFGGPDDLYAAPDGTLYFSDIRAGEVGVVPPRGRTARVVATGLSVPEGIVAFPGGGLLVVEQGKNRIDRLQPDTGRWTVWQTVRNPTTLEGVDNVQAGPQGLLVPDSPLGRLLLMPWNGGAAQVLATGMTRPTSVWRAGDGTLYIADETGHALWSLAPGAALPRRIATLPEPDDVVGGPRGSLLVSDLHGTVVEVDPASGSVTPLVQGLGSPQGLVADGSGYAVADETGDRIYVLEGDS